MSLHKKRKVVTDYYEYSTNYVRNRVRILIAVLLSVILLSAVYIYVYNYIPKSAFINAKKMPNEVSESKLVIADVNGKYFTGSFTKSPTSIPINTEETKHLKETLQIYIFQDSNIALYKFYKHKNYRSFSYSTYNFKDKDINTIFVNEEKKNNANEKTTLDFYDNFTKVQIEKTNMALSMVIPVLYNSSSKLTAEIKNILNTDLSFSLTNFYASMVNWKNNRALYIATYSGFARGYLNIPGSDNNINSDNSFIAINTVGETPNRYEQEIVTGIFYMPYSYKPSQFFIYDATPASQNSKIIRYLTDGEWKVFTNFISHKSDNFTDYYLKNEGFSFVFTANRETENKERKLFRLYKEKTEYGLISGYITVNEKQIEIKGDAVREKLHTVN